MAGNKVLELETKILLLEAELERVTTPPFQVATIIDAGEKTMRVASGPTDIYEVLLNPGLKEKLQRGARVVLNPQTKAVMGYSEFQPQSGDLAVVDEVMEDKLKISVRGEPKIILTSLTGIKSGDEVMLDPSTQVAVKKTDSKKTKYNLEEVPTAPWANIGGLDSVIDTIRAEIEEPFQYKDTFQRYGRKPAKGILLFGPPGCGKTMVAKSIAYSLSQLAGTEGKTGHFINVKGPEILDKWVGNSEGNIRRIYSAARETASETKSPVVVFIDEAESVLKRRGSGISTDVYDSIVPQFLAELDGINGNGNVITVLATNREDILDPAVVRDGRIDRRIKVPRPNREGAEEIFNLYLAGKPIEGNLLGKKSPERLAREITQEIYDPKNIAYRIMDPRKGQIGEFTYSNLVSGAMIKGIVDRACGYAIRREIDTKKKNGLSKTDLQRAVKEEFADTIDFTQALVADDWQNVFKSKGKYMMDMHDNGYLVLEKGNETQLNETGGKT